MFNIRNLVNRISQVKDGEVSDTSSNRSRSLSQASNVFSDEGASVEAEGFLCPTCFVAFPSADDLQSHYQSDHLEPGANYLCPVCKARLNTASDLELHYSSNHSSSSARASGDVDSLVRQISELNSSLSEERWNGEELRKEVGLLKEMVKAQGTGEEHQMYQQQLEGLQETKTLLTSEIVLIRKQLAEALESTLTLKQDRERLEEKAAKSSQTVAQLQAALDENSGLTAALKENIQQLEAELEHKSSLDDAKLLKQELSSVQRLMDEMTQAKEEEKRELQKKFDELQLEHETLKNVSTGMNSTIKDDDYLSNSIEQFEATKLQMEMENNRLMTELADVKRALTDKSEQLNALQHQREETDVCVGHLREEVTSLQDMLDLARQSAEGQVSAKEDELCNTKVELMKHQQQNTQLDSRCKDLEKSNDQLSQNITTLTKDVEERNQSLKQMKSKVAQLEEKIERMENEKAELMVTIQKGEGFDTAIQQLQQDNARLQQELTKTADEMNAAENRHREKADEWSKENTKLKEELKRVQETVGNLSNELEQAQQNRDNLQSALDQSVKKVEEWKEKHNQLEAKLHESEKKISTLTSQMESKNGEVLKLQQELKAVTDKKEASLQEIEKLTVKLNEANMESNKLKQSLKEVQDNLAKSKADHQNQVDRLNEELVNQKSAIAAKEKEIGKLKERVAELEPFVEALEEEKLLRIREKAEWAEHEQLFIGEKESLSTLTIHLKQQLDEQLEEHKIHVQRFKTETDALVKDKNLLTEQLNAEKDAHSKHTTSWMEKHSKLEEDLKSLTDKLGEAEELSSTRYQRCEELQASTEKYHSQKIELEARVELLLEEKANLQNNNNQWETEVDRLKFNAVELRRRLEDSQAALHELGRENQSLQMENAKLQGRKWADDSEVDECLSCHKGFNLTVRKHHCRNCGQIFCNECSAKLTAVGNSKKPVRVCDPCFKELNNAPR